MHDLPLYATVRPEHLPAVKLFLLRLLVPLNGHDKFILPGGFKDDALAHVLGLGEWVDPIDRDFDPKAVRRELRRLHQAIESAPRDGARPTCLARNIERLSDLVGLSDLDCRILEFSVLIHNERLLEDTSELLGYLNASKAVRALAVLLAEPERGVQEALRMDGILSRSGLVSLERNGSSELCSKLDLLSLSFADHIASSDADPISLLRKTVSLCSPGDLRVTDYAHVSPLLDVLRPYLKTAVASGRVPYEVRLVREGGTRLGALATMNVQVVAPTNEMAKKTAEARWPGYRAINAQRSE
jgi:transitional endoplasmic reticulum ATPase